MKTYKLLLNKKVIYNYAITYFLKGNFYIYRNSVYKNIKIIKK